ncbi:MAG: FIST C-terminal domain-containing protein [Burkholderiales bacterium]|nr:FIST C-terminal domain-containing protein [Burkholderiales bacterium]MDE1927886.1 FIST C-terminal domain-containing protein [Burkholderiales bacterium]
MSGFLVGHATHPDWRGALALAAAQIEGARARGAAAPTLGFVYLTDAYAGAAEPLLAELQLRWPGVAWVGSVGVGVAASGVEYFDEPALVLMLADLPAGAFEVYSGARKLQRIDPYSALVHADPATPDLAELIAELAERMGSGYLFGGLASPRRRALHIADGVWEGGLSGVAFDADVALVSRVTQGCQPIGPTRSIDACERHIALTLDGEPALACLLRDLGVADLGNPRELLPRLRGTLVGLTDARDEAGARAGQFGSATRVRHLIGIDPARRAVAVADPLEPGLRMAYCQRDVAAARRDLVRICSEIREELAGEPGARARPLRGALYVSCSGRGGPHFGGPSAELQIVQHALGDVPLVGYFAGGEIARHHLYGYTGVLTVFTA